MIDGQLRHKFAIAKPIDFTDKKESLIASDGLFNPILFVAVESFTIDLSLFTALLNMEQFDLIEAIGGTRYRSAISMEPYEGWHLCVKQEHVDNNWDEYWKSLGKQAIQHISDLESSIAPQGKAGPKDRYRDALIAYDTLFPKFPNSKPDGLSWEQCARVVKLELEKDGINMDVKGNTLGKKIRERS